MDQLGRRALLEQAVRPDLLVLLDRVPLGRQDMDRLVRLAFLGAAQPAPPELSEVRELLDPLVRRDRQVQVQRVRLGLLARQERRARDRLDQLVAEQRALRGRLEQRARVVADQLDRPGLLVRPGSRDPLAGARQAQRVRERQARQARLEPRAILERLERQARRERRAP